MDDSSGTARVVWNNFMSYPTVKPVCGSSGLHDKVPLGKTLKLNLHPCECFRQWAWYKALRVQVCLAVTQHSPVCPYTSAATHDILMMVHFVSIHFVHAHTCISQISVSQVFHRYYDNIMKVKGTVPNNTVGQCTKLAVCNTRLVSGNIRNKRTDWQRFTERWEEMWQGDSWYHMEHMKYGLQHL